MNVIKEDVLTRLQKTRRFTCRKCGCVFDAEKGEYELSTSSYNEEYYFTKCPTCGDTVWEGSWLR